MDEVTAEKHERVELVADDEKGVTLSLSEAGQGPSLFSDRYLFFGKVTVEAQAAQGQGIVTAIVLKSDSGDEIDWVR